MMLGRSMLTLSKTLRCMRHIHSSPHLMSVVPDLTTSKPAQTLYYQHSPNVPDASDNGGKFAIIKLSGSQMKVTPGDRVTTHKIEGKNAGDEVVITDVLLVGNKEYTVVGAPVVSQARVVASVEQQTRGGKVMVFKMKRRKGYRRTHGEAPYITVLKIEDIILDK